MHIVAFGVVGASLLLAGSILWATGRATGRIRVVPRQTIYATAAAALLASTAPPLMVIGDLQTNPAAMITGAITWSAGCLGLLIAVGAHYHAWSVARNLAELGNNSMVRHEQPTIDGIPVAAHPGYGRTSLIPPKRAGFGRSQDYSRESDDDEMTESGDDPESVGDEFSIEKAEVYDLRFERFMRKQQQRTPGLADRQVHTDATSLDSPSELPVEVTDQRPS